MGTVTSVGSGNCNTGSTWDSGARPGSSDDVVIASGHTVTLAQNENANSLTIASGGTIVGAGYEITIDGEDSSGFAVNNDGTISGNLDLEINTQATTTCDFNGTSGNFQNIKLNHASVDATFHTDTTFDGTLIIAAGTLKPQGGSTIAVAGDTTVTGTFGVAAGSGAHSFGSVTINSGGTFIATSGTTTLTSETSGGYTWRNNGGTFTHNNGTVTTNSSVDTKIKENTFYNLIINQSSSGKFVYWEDTSGNTCTVANDLTITTGRLRGLVASDTVTVTGDVLVDANGTFNHTSVWTGSINHGSLTINSGGTYIATSGTTTLKSETSGGSTYVNDGTFTHNNGTLLLHADIPDTQVYAGSSSLYNVTSSTGNNVWLKENITIANDLTITSGTFGSGGGNDKEVTVHGNVFISGGEFGNGSETGAYTVKGLVTLTGGTFDLSSGTINLGGIRNVGGTIS